MEFPLDRIEVMASRYLAEIRTVQPAGPYFLGGFCAGGPIAYEMARQLEERGERVALLVLFDSWNPTALRRGWAQAAVPREIHAASRMRRLRRALRHAEISRLRHWIARKLAFAVKKLSKAAKSVRWAAVRRRAVLYARLGIAIPMNDRWDLIRNGMSDALDAYKIQPSDLRPVLFSSMLAHRLEWEQRYISPLGEDLGWREVVGDSLEICYLRCSNGTMFIDPHVRHLAAELRIRLAKAQSPRRMRAA